MPRTSVVIFGIRTQYATEVAGILHDLGYASELVDNYAVGDERESLHGKRFVLAGPNPAGRQDLETQAIALGLEVMPAVVHPSASVSYSAVLGRGTTVNRLVAVGGEVVMGKHCRLSMRVGVSHHCSLGDFVTLGAGVTLSGGVTIGNRVLVGSGAVVLPGVTIGDDVTVGAGAVVTRPVPPGVTVAGVPARVLSDGNAPSPQKVDGV